MSIGIWRLGNLWAPSESSRRAPKVQLQLQDQKQEADDAVGRLSEWTMAVGGRRGLHVRRERKNGALASPPSSHERTKGWDQAHC
jgi:hypothetical protein